MRGFTSYFLLGLCLGLAIIVVSFLVAPPSHGSRVAVHSSHVKAASTDALTVYIRNFDPAHVSDKTIRNAIPAWEQAANGRFRQVWHTPKVKLVLATKVPAGAVEADFTNAGPIKGALAYHTQNKGRPAIVVYVGADDYYGYSDSVSFTHELFELLADEHTASINQGFPVDYITLDHGQFAPSERFRTPPGQLLINEVCDPVEAYHYSLKGRDGSPVFISDWVTQNYFNDEQAQPAGVGYFDAMGLVQQPVTLLPGGYQSLFVVKYRLWDGLRYVLYTGWVSVTDFRHAPGRDPGGYMDDHDGKVIAR